MMTNQKNYKHGVYKDADFIIKMIDFIVSPLIWYSVIMLVLEVEPSFALGGEHSLSGTYHNFFLWSERVVAGIFTIEFLVRLFRSQPGKYVWINWKFPFIHLSPFAWIDFISVVPFWAGFFVPIDFLRYIRIMRIFRFLKYYRYSRSLQLNALGFYRAWHQLKGVAFQLFVLGLIFTMIVFEAEHIVQPDKYGNLFQSAWFTVVTITTVGYGDRSPITPIGMTFVGVVLIFVIAQACSAIGILNASFSKVMEEEIDPSIDPLDLWEKEFQESKKIRMMDRDYEMKEDI